MKKIFLILRQIIATVVAIVIAIACLIIGLILWHKTFAEAAKNVFAAVWRPDDFY